LREGALLRVSRGLEATYIEDVILYSPVLRRDVHQQELNPWWMGYGG